MVEGVKSSFQAFKHKKPSSCLSPKIFQMVKITSWVDGTEWLFKQNLWLFFLPKEDDLVCENGKGIVFFLGVKVQRPRARWEIRTDSLCQWCSPSHLPTPSRWMQLSSNSICSVQFSCSAVSDSLRPHGLQHARFPCSPTPRACSNSCPLSRWCHPTVSSSVFPFSSCLQSFPASRSFPVKLHLSYPEKHSAIIQHYYWPKPRTSTPPLPGRKVEPGYDLYVYSLRAHIP